MKRTYGRNTKHTRLTLGESKQLRKLASNVDTLAQLTDSTGLDEEQFQSVLFELGLDLTKMLTLLENKIPGQSLSVRMYIGATNINSFEWVNTSNWQRLEVSEMEFDPAEIHVNSY